MRRPDQLSTRLFGLLALGLAALPAAHAATCTTTSSGNWSNAATWSGCPAPGGSPNNNDNVIIQSGHTITLDINSRNLDTLTLQAGAVLQGNGSATLKVGKSGGEDLLNNGTINFSGATAATVLLNRDSQWAGNGTWNLSAVNLNGRALSFTAGSSFTINLSGAGDPLQNPGAVNSPATATTVTWNYNGSAAQATSNNLSVLYGHLTINNAVGVTLGRNLTTSNLLGNLTVASGTLNDGGFTITGLASRNLSVANGATLSLTNASGMATGFGSKTFGATSTVNYARGGDQPVSAETYGHLILSGSGTKTPASGTTAIQGNFTLASGVTYAGTSNNPTVSLAGSFTNSGIFNSGSNTFTFNGNSAQTLTGATTFTRLALNNAAGLTINNDVTVGTLLTLTNGVITTGSNTLITSANCAAAVSRVNGWVAGFLRKSIPTGVSVNCTYEIGDAGDYRPVALAFPLVASLGNITASVSQTVGDHPNIATSSINSARSVNRYWTLSNSGVVFTTGYDATFNFVAGDVDAGASTGVFQVERYSGGAWSTTAAGTRTATSTEATSLTGFGDFAIGEQGVSIDHFAIDIGAASASTCAGKSITLTAQDAANGTVIGYTGAVTISTSSGHGDWSIGTANGTLTNGTADDGAASYTFATTDNGVVTLILTDTHADDLTISVVDNTVPSSLSTSATISFRDNVFVITEDAVQVAGRGQSMSAALWTRDSVTGNCAVNTAYSGSRNLKAWLTRDGDDPGGAAPAIGALSVPNAPPGAANLTLTFSSGVANFTLSTSDVGKYALNLLDDSQSFASVNISGASNSITTRPFGLALTGIQRGATANPGGSAATDPVFIAAGLTFEATVGGYLWAAADDADDNGVPDSGADITDNGLAASFAWPVTLTAALNTPSGGTAGALGGTTSVLQAGFTGGAATVSDLTYSEVGSFTLTAALTAYLNAAGADFNDSEVAGRFTPDHFVVSALENGSLANGCGTFTYTGQMNGSAGAIGYATAPRFTITAQNAANATTTNYTGAFAKLANTGITITPPTEDATQNGLDGTTKMALTANIFAGTLSDNGDGTFRYVLGADDSTYTRNANALIAPFTSDLRLVIATIAEPAAPAGDGVTTTFTGQELKPAGVEIRFGRLVMQNAYGSELVGLPINLTAEYYAGTAVGFAANADDNCTGVANTDMTLTTTLTTSLTAAASNPFSAGNWHDEAIGAYTKLTAPNTPGTVDLTLDLDAAALSWLKYDWNGTDEGADGDLFDDNPAARAVFGIYEGPERRIYLREVY